MAGGSVHALVDRRDPGGEKLDPGMDERAVFGGEIARQRIGQEMLGVEVEEADDFGGHERKRPVDVHAGQPVIQVQGMVGVTRSAEIDAAWSMLLKDCADATAMTEAGRLADLETGTRWRRNNSFAVQLCLRAADRLYALAGMRAMEPDSPIARIWRDIRAASSQVGTAWDPQGTNYGKALFGLPLSDPLARS